MYIFNIKLYYFNFLLKTKESAVMLDISIYSDIR